MQSPAVCKKSLPGPIRLKPNQVGYPFTSILYAIFFLPAADPRGFPAAGQLVQLKQQTATFWNWRGPLGAAIWELEVGVDINANPGELAIRIGASLTPPGYVQNWSYSGEIPVGITLDTRDLAIPAGPISPTTAEARLKLWR